MQLKRSKRLMNLRTNPPQHNRLSLLPGLFQYGQAVNTHDLLKVVGIVLMLIDHTGYLFENDGLLRTLGRGAAPLFFFLIGYSGKLHCHWRLVLYAIVLSLVGMLFFYNTFWLNILFSFMFAHVIMTYYPATKAPTWLLYSLFICLLLLHIPLMRFLEYGATGILITLTAHWMRHDIPYARLLFSINLILHIIWQAIAFSLLSNMLYLTLLSGIGFTTWAVLTNYQLITLKWPKSLILPTLFTARYSLDIYFFHLIIIQGWVIYKIFFPN